MKTDAPSLGRPDYANVTKHACPLCDGNLIRIGRRPMDRLLNLFVRVHRYRCNVFTCQWEGILRVDSVAGTRTDVLPR